MELMQASRQWATRPADERFVSLPELLAHVRTQRTQSKALQLNSRAISAAPFGDTEDDMTRGLAIVGPGGNPVLPTNWAFGQLAGVAGAPSAYLRKLPAPLAADCINHGLAAREVEDVQVLLRQNGSPILSAITGPGYGRVWNDQVASALVDRFGDGLTGQFRVPGEFGQRVEVTKENTTLYAGDRDMFVFLADEERRITVPNRRNGQPGELARGFFVWNSEVGAATLGIATFLFDYVCSNRIVWGATGFQEVRIRHTSGAPHRFIEQAAPALVRYAEASAAGVQDAITSAQAKKLGAKDRVADFLSKRFTRSQAAAISKAHLIEEQRPIETLWDAVTGATAYAKSIDNQDDRVAIERKAGELLKLAD